MLFPIPAINLRYLSAREIDSTRPEFEMGIKLSQRTSANLNGALIVIGLLGTLDNVLVHWILGLHRLIEGSAYTLHAEIALVIASSAILAIGIYREWTVRQRLKFAKPNQRNSKSSSTA
jgi:hypothetical protein